MTSKEQLTQHIQQYAAPEFRAFLLASIRAAVQLSPQPHQPIQLGGSKFGGAPHLPQGATWPTHPSTATPFSFLAQIQLDALPTHTALLPLPTEGMLYFFINTNDPTEGRVLFEPQPQALHTAPIPDALHYEYKNFFQRLLRRPGTTPYILPEVGFDMDLYYTIPQPLSFPAKRLIKSVYPNAPLHDPKVHDLLLYELDWWEQEVDQPIHAYHHLGGYASFIQEDNFHEQYSLDTYRSVQELSLVQMDDLLQWQLLFQCDSDNRLSLNWGDWGRVYFYMHREDLKAKRFDRVRLYWDTH